VKVLFVAPRFPAPSTHGDRLRAFYLIRELSKRHAITLVAPPNLDPDLRVLEYCRRWVRVQPQPVRRIAHTLRGLHGRLPLQTLLFCEPALQQAARRLQREEQFDVVHLHTARVGPAAVAGQVCVLDYIDALSLNMQRRAQHESLPLRLALQIESRRMQRYEQNLARCCQAAFVSSPVDRRALGAEMDIQVVPNGIDPQEFPYVEQGRDERTIVFTGRMGYFPNADAAQFLVHEVWPLVRCRHPDARLQIVGADPTPAVQQLARHPGVIVTGRVERMELYLQRATVALAPLRAGTGLQLKVLEAMASGAPVAGTSRALEGIGVRDGHEALVADTPQALAVAICALLDDPARRVELARRARALVEQTYTWERIALQIDDIYARAVETAHM
jgi:sugar transferase (PEP-CTERM/EpsH1 system associated)